MNSKLVRRLSLALVVPLALLAAGCGSSDDDGKKGPSKDLGSVTIVGQKFPEADIMAELYKGLLDNAGFKASVKALGGRDLYLEPLEKGDVQISTDYLSSMTEALNRQANGDDADLVASHDSAATLTALNKLAGPVGLTALKPAEAQDANGFAVTKKFADENNVKTLSDLAELGKDLKLGAAPDCDKRPDCKGGLESHYGLKISSVVPTGFGSDETKADLKSGATQLGQVGTSDATLEKDGLVLLEDDEGPAERREPGPDRQHGLAQGPPGGRGRAERAVQRADHRGPRRADRAGLDRSREGGRRGAGVPEGQGLLK